MRYKLGPGIVQIGLQGLDSLFMQVYEALLEAYNTKYAGRDSRRVEITEERLKTIRGVCLKVHNEEFAARCVEKVKENGYFSAVQRYFGLHYRADRMPIRNLEFMKIREEAGFTWFKEFKPNTA